MFVTIRSDSSTRMRHRAAYILQSTLRLVPPSPTSDVAIVGAGPAGAWTAWRLARKGARVSIFDGSHPREKPCGGGVTGRALALVAPAVSMRDLPAIVIESARFEANGRAADVSLTSDDPTSPPLIVTPRASFDGALADAAWSAGARRVSERVVDVQVGRDGVVLTTRQGTHRAAVVVGADGVNSLVRRRVHRPFPRTDLSIATGFYVRGRSSREIVVGFSFDPPGYMWSFPRPDHLAIGMCAPADRSSAAALRRAVVGWVERAGLGSGAELEPYAWPIPSLAPEGWDRARVSGDRWLLVGDAAGLVDPITREGIYWALESATLAASAIVGPGAAATYADRLRDEIVPELVAAGRLQSGFFRPAFLSLLLDALASSGRIRAVMADLVSGRQPYTTLRRRLLRTFEWKLAWRMMKN